MQPTPGTIVKDNGQDSKQKIVIVVAAKTLQKPLKANVIKQRFKMDIQSKLVSQSFLT